MGTDEKIDAKKDEVAGQVKETWGKATDDKDTEIEGKAQQVKGDLRQGWEKTKDAAKDATD